MTKSDLVAKIAERSGVAKIDVERTLRSFEEIVQETVAAGGDKVSIPGFVSFERVQRAGRLGRNPRTGELIEVPPGPSVRVSAGATLKRIARGNGGNGSA
jgi:DNA-binding protein HU-beta